MQICHLVCLAAMQLISPANTAYIQREYSEPSGLTIPSYEVRYINNNKVNYKIGGRGFRPRL